MAVLLRRVQFGADICYHSFCLQESDDADLPVPYPDDTTFGQFLTAFPEGSTSSAPPTRTRPRRPQKCGRAPSRGGPATLRRIRRVRVRVDQRCCGGLVDEPRANRAQRDAVRGRRYMAGAGVLCRPGRNRAAFRGDRHSRGCGTLPRPVLARPVTPGDMSGGAALAGERATQLPAGHVLFGWHSLPASLSLSCPLPAGRRRGRARPRLDRGLDVDPCTARFELVREEIDAAPEMLALRRFQVVGADADLP